MSTPAAQRRRVDLRLLHRARARARDEAPATPRRWETSAAIPRARSSWGWTAARVSGRVVAARRLAERFGARLWPVVAHGGKGVNADLAELIAGRHREDGPDEPLVALVAAAADADLLVVGSRGLYDPRMARLLSEHLATRARSCVLIVRSRRGNASERSLERSEAGVVDLARAYARAVKRHEAASAARRAWTPLARASAVRGPRGVAWSVEERRAARYSRRARRGKARR